MNKENVKLDEQSAPEKNGDKAFVQVGADGKPVVPQEGEETTSAKNDAPREGTLADR